MKVVAFNGSPHAEGNTYQSLRLVGEELEKENIEFEIYHVGNKAVRACLACNGCVKNKDERCVIATDEVNEWIQNMKDADGILIGSPVHFSGIAGAMKSFLDRAFYVASVNNSMLRHKVGAAVVAVRRSGGVVTFDALNHYINYSEMILSGSNYWNVAHGTIPGDVQQDGEGVQVLRILGKNMAWLLKVMAAGKPLVAPLPGEKKTLTNFIR
ncbi:MAG: NADPH-dependent reductase [Firmicutes bacterium]|nr:NADPH-dependent reductase [Bacillota bacterium]